MSDTPTNSGAPEPTGADVSAVVEAAETIAAQGAGELVGAGVGAVTASSPVAPPVSMPTRLRPKVGYIAQGGQAVFNQGAELNFEQIGQAMESVRTRRPGPGGEPTSGVIASLPEFGSTEGYDMEILTRNTTPERATALIQESAAAWKLQRAAQRAAGGGVTASLSDHSAITASLPAHVRDDLPTDEQGGTDWAVVAAICEPLDIQREIPHCGITDTPFADQFPSRPIGRLGFQFYPAISMAETEEGITWWTQGDQDAIEEDDSSTWKPTVDITCAETVPVKAEELTASARVDDSTEMSSPERVAEFMHKLSVARARIREKYVITKYDATASAFTATYDKIGAFPAFLDAINTLLPQLVYGERLDPGDYNLWLEPGHLERLMNDENAKLFSDTDTGRRAEVIRKIEDETGAMVKVLLDFKGAGFDALPDPGDAAVELPPLPDSNRVRLVPAGDYLYAATGEQSTGWMTDGRLVRMNKKQWFSKEWLLIAKWGCAPAAFVDIASCANGARAAGVAPATCDAEVAS